MNDREDQIAAILPLLVHCTVCVGHYGVLEQEGPNYRVLNSSERDGVVHNNEVVFRREHVYKIRVEERCYPQIFLKAKHRGS